MTDDLLPRYNRSDMNRNLRELFRELGGNVPMRVLGDEAVTRGVIPPEEVAHCTSRGVQEICRRALKVKTENGLPFAKPIDGSREDNGDTRWKQIELFSYDEAEALIVRESKAIRDDYQELLLLHRWCALKFGKAPDIPELVDLDPVG
jgi:hypothetical protein